MLKHVASCIESARYMGNTSIVKQDVDRTQTLLRVIECGFDFIGIGHICHEFQHFSSRGTECGTFVAA
ncbi:hypothetical protein D3C72_2352750 [compost metagenome]